MITAEEQLIKAIKLRLEDVAEEELKKCEDNIRQRMAEYVSGTVIKLMERVRIDSVGNELKLTVVMPDSLKK